MTDKEILNRLNSIEAFADLIKQQVTALKKELGVNLPEQQEEKPIKKPLITDAESTEYLLNMFKKKHRK